ncbi:MAG: hypothetical protein ACK5P7_09620 [Bdellovibrio sp.]|jgi:hypothetical protein
MKTKMILSLAVGLASTLNPLAQALGQTRLARPPQYIMISFDGGYNADMWKATRDHALATNAKVAHFISGVDFLMGSSSRRIEGATDHIYRPPRWTSGRRSDIGFGGDRSEVTTRINEMKKSMDAGMEISGHANAHFNGSAWTADEWRYEFNLFNEYVTNVFKINKISETAAGVRSTDWKNSLDGHLKGFRAPYLGRGPGLWAAMATKSWVIDGKPSGPMLYDASDVAQSPTEWPEKSNQGFWYLRMAVIPVPGMSHGVLSMDYNFYAAQSPDANAPKENPAMAPHFEEQMYGAYINWFSRNYYGNRAPMNIGHHFSTWNKGAYWKALKRFMTNVCNQPEVRCITGVEMVEILEKTPTATLAAYARGEFDRGNTPRIDLARTVRIADERPATDTYRWIKDGIADLPRAEGTRFSWKSGDKDLNLLRLRLADLAQKGLSRIDLVVKKSDQPEQKVPFMIDWNPASGEATLVRWNEPLLKACDSDAHAEHVDKKELVDGIEI